MNATFSLHDNRAFYPARLWLRINQDIDDGSEIGNLFGNVSAEASHFVKYSKTPTVAILLGFFFVLICDELCDEQVMNNLRRWNV